MYLVPAHLNMDDNNQMDGMKKLPDLHKQAFAFKNRKRLQHDGGRAWIRDSQLQEMRKDGNLHLETIREKLQSVSRTD